MFFYLWCLFPQSPSSSFSRAGKSMSWVLLASLILILKSPASLENENPGGFLQSRVLAPPTNQNGRCKRGQARSGTLTARDCLCQAWMASNSDLQSWTLTLTFSYLLAQRPSNHSWHCFCSQNTQHLKAVSPGSYYREPRKEPRAGSGKAEGIKARGSFPIASPKEEHSLGW